MKLRMRIQYVPTNPDGLRYQVQLRYQWFTDWTTPWLNTDENRKHLAAVGLTKKQIDDRLHLDQKEGFDVEAHLRHKAFFATQDIAIAFSKSFYDRQLIIDRQSALDEIVKKQKLAALGKQRVVWKWP